MSVGLLDLYSSFPTQVMDWLELKTNEINAGQKAAIAAVKFLKNDSDVNYVLLRLVEKFMVHVTARLSNDKIVSLGEALSALLGPLTLLSVPGGTRIAHLVEIRAFNEDVNSGVDFEGLRNVFMFQNTFSLLSNKSKAGAIHGVLFDYREPQVIIPNIDFAPWLLRYIAVILPVVCSLLHKKMLANVGLTPTELNHKNAVLCLKSIHPFVPLTYNSTVGPGELTRKDFFKHAASKVTGLFRSKIAQCKYAMSKAPTHLFF